MPKFILHLLLALILSSGICAQEADEQAQKANNDALIQTIGSGEPTSEQWAEALTKLASPELRTRLEKAIAARSEFPRKAIVDLLTHPQLAVRIGALEVLEDASGDTFQFSPWLEPDSSESNKTALALWQRWASDDTKINKKSAKLSPDQIQSYIQNLLSDDRARSARAIRMMESDNFSAVSAIQQFIAEHPNLPPAKIAQLKQAQYELVLIKAARATAPNIARDLVTGNRDQQLAAISNLKRLGLVTIPIIRDFIASPDALVRETALDAIITVGGRQVLPVAAARLKEEDDVNVIHIAIRKIKDIPGADSLAIIEQFLDHEDEDIVVSAINAITKLGSDSSSTNRITISKAPSSIEKPSPEESKKSEKNASTSLSPDQKIIALLSDPRWRVRVAAITHVTENKLTNASDKILELLENDQDEFVRSTAIKAATALNIKNALPIYIKMFKEHDDLIGSITPAIVRLNGSLTPELFKHLETRDPDTVISALKAFEGDDEEELKVLAKFAKNPNLDIACVALRTLANDEDKIEISFVANTLTDALNSESPEKIQAIITSIDLPTTNSIDPRLMRLQNTEGLIQEKTDLDPLYDAFLRPNGKELKPFVAVNTQATGGVSTLTDTLHKIATTTKNKDQTFQIALVLTKAGDQRGIALITENVKQMPISKRSALVEALYTSRHSSVIPIFKALLQDESKEIRVEASQNACASESNTVLIKLNLDNLTLPDTKLRSFESYHSYIENAARQSNASPIIQAWCRTQLQNPEVSDELKILAIILMRHDLKSSDEKFIILSTQSTNQWVRRAAWHCLGTNSSNWFDQNIAKLTSDPSANVRATLPEVTSTSYSVWNHVFNDIESKSDNSYSSSRSRRRINPTREAALGEMTKIDLSETNRFEAAFSLLSHSRPIDLNAFISLIGKQPKESRAVYRLSNIIENNYHRMGKGMLPLLAYVDFKNISDEKHAPIMAHFNSDQEEKSTGFNTFQELANVADTSTAAPQHLSTPEQLDESNAKREKLTLIFFEKDGCAQCAKAIKVAEDLKKDFPMMEIKRVSITSDEGILLNAHLSRKLNLPASADGKVPSFFTSSGYIVSPITAQRLGGILEENLRLPVEKDWYILEAQAPEQIQAAKQHVEEKFDSLTLPVVILGGLLDGINPCAFATIIFFLSYLTVAKRSPKEIFLVGAAFILAVFLSYLSVGLLLSSFVKTLTENTSYLWLKDALNYIFAAFALLVAILSFRDFLKARKGNLQDMTLQLPTFLKNKIRGVIRKGAKSSNFVIAAFLSGIAISFLELACTGQVYAPIIYKINQGSADAATMLVIYNLAFILPLVIIFALAMGGMKSNALINFQQKHTGIIKLLTAALFLILAIILIFSEQIGGLLKKYQPDVQTTQETST